MRISGFREYFNDILIYYKKLKLQYVQP